MTGGRAGRLWPRDVPALILRTLLRMKSAVEVDADACLAGVEQCWFARKPGPGGRGFNQCTLRWRDFCNAGEFHTRLRISFD